METKMKLGKKTPNKNKGHYAMQEDMSYSIKINQRKMDFDLYSIVHEIQMNVLESVGEILFVYFMKQEL